MTSLLRNSFEKQLDCLRYMINRVPFSFGHINSEQFMGTGVFEYQITLIK